MTITSTHPAGTCIACDALRAALANVTSETCARRSDTACVAFAEFPPCNHQHTDDQLIYVEGVGTCLPYDRSAS